MAKSKMRVAQQVDLHIGKFIRYQRIFQGMTQSQLGEKLRLSYQQIQKYETGANRISCGRLYEMGLVLDFDSGEAVKDFKSTKAVMPLPHGGTDRATHDLVNSFRHIKQKDIRTTIGSLVRLLAKNVSPG
ncbi:helix-turn-helix transcriptional regulator [candidate division TA06 bacterium]|nr:helix-turn-helix transcriptional regulator [candidate division TA06 bacterium]